ncbi:MAG: LysR family transcriptional regulator [Veillonellales bacterium]
MDLRQLKYFLTVVEEGLITKAAKRLNMTQPPLSQQLILLEKELGTQLFDRGKPRIQLTETGNILQRRAVQIMELIKTTVNELQEATDGISGRLTIGTITSSGGSLLPTHIQEFHKHYPKVTFLLHQGETMKILELLKVGIIEIGFVRFPFDCELYDYLVLPKESMVAAANSNILHPQTEPIQLCRLMDQPLLVHQRHVSMVTEHCRENGFEPTILCASDDITPLLIWANLGIGIAIVPESATNLFSGSSLGFYKITPDSIKTTSAIIWSKNRPLSGAASHFIALFK